MDNYQIIAEHCQGTIEHLVSLVDDVAPTLEQASELITGAMLADGKVIACGSGADGAQAQLFACNMIGRFEQDRPALPVIALGGDGTIATAAAAAEGLQEVFSRPLQALGREGDVLLCVNSQRVAPEIAAAILAARDRNMPVVLLSNDSNTGLGSLMGPQDLAISVPNGRRPHIIELQTLLLNCLCELIENSLFGSINQE